MNKVSLRIVFSYLCKSNESKPEYSNDETNVEKISVTSKNL